MYLSYTEYTQMGGTLTATAFENFESEAESVIDWYTFNRLQNDTTISDKVKRCVFAIIANLQKKSNVISGDNDTATITSQSNDGVSISYNVMSASDLYNACKEESIGIVQKYLNGVKNSSGKKVLYRGTYQDE